MLKVELPGKRRNYQSRELLPNYIQAKQKYSQAMKKGRY